MRNPSTPAVALFVIAIAKLAAAQAPESGQRLVEQSARNLFELRGLESAFRYRIEAYEQTLLGTGRYLQSGTGPEKLFLLELNAQLEDGKATQQTICGTQYLWIRRDFGPDRQTLARVSLRALRQALEDTGGPLATDPSPTWMAITSLPKLMSAVGTWFVFQPAEEAVVEDRQVLRLRGEINQAMRDQFLSGSAKKNQGREQIPDAVELTLGTDQALPLFPYRIVFTKADRSMLTVDFYSAKVHNQLDPQQFEYFSGDQEVEDRTRLFLQRLGLPVKED